MQSSSSIGTDDSPGRPSRRARLRAAIPVAILAVAMFGAGAGFGRMTGAASSGAGGDAVADPAHFALVRQAWQVLHEYYVERSSLDGSALAHGAIDGMTQAVGDPGHTTFLTPDERTFADQMLNGSFVGIGAEFDASAGRPVILGVVHGSPADRAGLRPGDVIEAVDGKPVAGQPVDTIIASIRGPAGTTVVLTVRHVGATSDATLRITRAVVRLPIVTWGQVPGSRVADIRIDQFATGATKALVAALQASGTAGLKPVVLDLRGNPGGLVDEAIGVASQFLGSGVVYIEQDASGKRTSVPVRGGGVATNRPLVVLVDGATASASEIVAGALQDAGRAKLVGTRTFGTGTVVGEFPLADGSALRVGTVLWLTPKGRVIWRHGIDPDIVVERPSDARPLTPDDLRAHDRVTEADDPQLFRALQLLGGS